MVAGAHAGQAVARQRHAAGGAKVERETDADRLQVPNRSGTSFAVSWGSSRVRSRFATGGPRKPTAGSGPRSPATRYRSQEVLVRQDPQRMLAAMASIPECVDPAVRAWWVDEARRAGHDREMSSPSPRYDWVFRVELEQVNGVGNYTLGRIRRGPFLSPEAAEASLLQVIRAWDARAKDLGGWCWRRTATRWSSPCRRAWKSMAGRG